MKKILIPILLICSLGISINATTDNTEPSSEKKDYTFKSSKPIKQTESLYVSVMSATPTGVQNTTGTELVTLKDSIKRMALNPTGINVTVVKKNKKGRYLLETYTTNGVAEKLMSLDVKKYGTPYAAAYTPDSRQLAVATDKATWLFETKKFKPCGELPLSLAILI